MLVIDYQKVVRPNAKILGAFLSKIGKIPQGKNVMLGLILDVPDADVKHLDALPLGEERVRFLNNITVNKVSWVFFNPKRKLCELYDITPENLEVIKREFPSFSHWIGVDSNSPSRDSIIDCCIDSGYGHPYMSDTSPLGHVFGEYGVCMSRLSEQADPKSVRVETHYVIEQFANNHEKNCDLKIQLSDKAIKYLKSLPLAGYGSGKQKEISGMLVIKNAKKIGDLFVYTVCSASESKVGKAETVTLDKSLYNFHSHPKEAYNRHRVKYAWPSTQDFIGYYDAVMQYRTIFHGVASLEGLYFISLHKDFPAGERELDEDEIANAYEIGRDEVSTPYEFVEHANNIKSKFFTIGFLPWERSHEIISISYPKFEDNCFVSDKSLEAYMGFK